jgi:hypothetical protein
MVREANRLAVQYGPVRSDVALAQGAERTRIVATDGLNPTYTLQLVQEDASPANTRTLETIRTYTVPAKVKAEYFADSVGAFVSVTPLADWDPGFVVKCYANGDCDGRTLFFQAYGNAAQLDYRARVSVMPLGGSVYIRRDWN